jgi:hypothetical protein
MCWLAAPESQERTHDVPDLRLAASRQRNTGLRKAERLEPFLHVHCPDLRQAISPPTRKNPPLQIALVGHLRGVRLAILVRIARARLRFAEDVRQFVLAIMMYKRFQTDVSDELLRGLFVDLQAERIYGSLGRRLGRKLLLCSDDDVPAPDRAIDLNFPPKKFPNLSFFAIRQPQTAFLITRAPHKSSISVEATRMAEPRLTQLATRVET